MAIELLGTHTEFSSGAMSGGKTILSLEECYKSETDFNRF